MTNQPLMNLSFNSLRSLSLVLLLTAACAVAGCNALGGGEGELQSCQQGGPLLPLQIGNTWTYDAGSGDPFTLEAAKTVATDSTEWTVVKDSETADGGTFAAFLNTTNGLYDAEYHERDAELDPASSFFRFPIEDGASYTFKGTEVSAAAETVEVPAGTFDVCTYTLENEVEGRRMFSFAPGVGIVRFGGADGRALKLTSRNFE